MTIDILIDDDFITTAIASKKGDIRIHKKSELGRTVLKALNENKKLELKV